MSLGAVLGTFFWLVGNVLLTLVALGIPLLDSLQLVSPGILSLPERYLHGMRLDKSTVRRVVGPAMGFRDGETVNAVFFVALFLPCSVLGWLHSEYAQLYVLLVLIAGIAWVNCVQVVYARSDYRLGTSLRAKPFFFVAVAWLLFDIFCVRALDPAYGRFPSSFAPIVLAWSMIVNILSYLCMTNIPSRLNRLSMTLHIEDEKSQVFLNNGNQFPAGEDAPVGYGIDSERLRVSSEELDSLKYLPVGGVIGTTVALLVMAMFAAVVMDERMSFRRYNIKIWCVAFVEIIVGILLAVVLGIERSEPEERPLV